MSSDTFAARKLSDHFAVCSQVSPQDMQAIASAGFRSIICNRPDGEEWGQPAFAELEAAAKLAGLETAFLPVSPSGISVEQPEKLATLLKELPHPILAFCRSGARSAGLWQAAQNA
jgi:sulfide:quinone oxidoreductase